MAATEDQKTHGVLLQVRHGDDILWEEADVEIRVRNSGARACQISDVFIETASMIHQVRPKGLPVMLDPNMSYSVRVQPEYFAPKDLTAEERLQTFQSKRWACWMGLERSIEFQLTTYRGSSTSARGCRFELPSTSTSRPETWW